MVHIAKFYAIQDCKGSITCCHSTHFYHFIVQLVYLISDFYYIVSQHFKSLFSFLQTYSHSEVLFFHLTCFRTPGPWILFFLLLLAIFFFIALDSITYLFLTYTLGTFLWNEAKKQFKVKNQASTYYHFSDTISSGDIESFIFYGK